MQNTMLDSFPLAKMFILQHKMGCQTIANKVTLCKLEKDALSV